MPSLERGFHKKIQEVTERARLDTYTANNLSIDDIGLILQEEITFKQREVGRNGKEGFTKMNEDDYLED
jgi:hypothetical protein